MRAFALALALLATPAAAADLQLNKAQQRAPAPEVYSWSGLYIDGYGLYGINFTNVTTQSLVTPTSIDLGAAPHGPGLGGAVKVLYQLPSSPWVIGLKGDIAWANLKGSGAMTAPGFALLSSNATNWLGDVNGVLGVALGDGKLLAYATGGFAFGGAKTSTQIMLNAQGISETSFGYNVGIGLEYAVTEKIALFIEGDYFQLGGKSFTITDPATGLPVASSSAAFNIAVQKAGLSFKF